MGISTKIRWIVSELILGYVTEMEADAAVNAASSQLQLGAGAAGVIRQKGGSSI